MNRVIMLCMLLAPISYSCANVIHLESKDQLNTLIKQRNVVVKFYATWCSGCKTLAPKFKELSDKYSSILFIDVDVDTHRALAQENKIYTIPCCLCFKNGSYVDRTKGPDTKPLITLLEKLSK